MLTNDILLTYEKEDLHKLAKSIDSTDINFLIENLNEKDDNIRYYSLLTLQHRSQEHNDVYIYWDKLVEKLCNTNSYQRSIGLLLIADNVKWDNEGKFEKIIDEYLKLCDDEKPITVRQCIQSLSKIVVYKPNVIEAIICKLLSINILERKETQRKLLLLDILQVFIAIKGLMDDNRINEFIFNALNSALLDKKSIKDLEKKLNNI